LFKYTILVNKLVSEPMVNTGWLRRVQYQYGPSIESLPDSVGPVKKNGGTEKGRKGVLVVG